MSSSLYIGPPGVGKTTALVRYVILPALERQQRVVTNVPLNEAAFCDRLGCNLDGLIVLVSSEQIRSPNFWFTAENCGETITKAGDCIVIDECHEFYGPDQKIKSDAEVFRAVRLQRKYTGGVGNFSTNIVFATQLYEDMTRSLRNVCDSMYYMQKLTVVGKPDSFRVDIYADCRNSPTRGRPVNQLFGTYDAEYYSLYNSYSTGVGGFSSDAPGVETVTDSRLNVWNSTMGFGPFKVTLKQAKYLAGAVAVLSFSLLIFFFYNFLSSPLPGVSESKAIEQEPDTSASQSVSVPHATQPASAFSPKLNESSEYRLVGFYDMSGMLFAVIADKSGSYRYLMKGAFSETDFDIVHAGPASHIKYRGQVISYSTGSPLSVPNSASKMETSK